jgi:Zn-dependent protease with chaperone function
MMPVSMYLPFVFSGLFGIAAPLPARRLPPAVGTWLLSVGGLLSAAGCALVMAFVGFTLIGQSPLLATRGHWSDTTLHQADPVPAPVALIALLALTVLAVRFTRAGVRRLTALREAYRLAAALPAAGGELAIIEHPSPQAYAVPGRPGRIVVSTGLLRGLDAGQRRAVLAHERAHLTHRHHWHHTLAHLAAAANPLLHRLPAAVALATERWADEDATATCRRETVAEALTRTAIAGTRLPAPVAVLAIAATDLLARVQALRAPAPRLTLWRVGLLIALLAATATAVLAAEHDTERLFELAQAAYRAGHQH